MAIMTKTPALDIQNTTLIYEGGMRALDDISLHISEGDFFALLGPNGAGKTTLINVIRTLLKKTNGNINVLGHNLDKNPFAIKSVIGCVPQEFNFNVFETVENVLIYNAGYQGVPAKKAKKKAAEVMEKLHLAHKAKNNVRMLSGGMKRRLMIARAIMHNPKLLLLDEPTAGVDIETRHATWSLLKELNQEGLTILLTTHYLEEAEHLCNELAIIHHGRIIKREAMSTLLNDSALSESILAHTEEPLPRKLNMPFKHTILSDKVIDIKLDKKTSIQQIFDYFNKASITLSRIRSPQSRLESLYTQLIHEDNQKRDTDNQKRDTNNQKQTGGT